MDAIEKRLIELTCEQLIVEARILEHEAVSARKTSNYITMYQAEAKAKGCREAEKLLKDNLIVVMGVE